MMDKPRRFWITFEPTIEDQPPAGSLLGVGVTAFDRADAFALVRERVFAGRPLPAIKAVVEDIDVSQLDQRHVIPNMGNVLIRGIWFPQGH